MKYLCFLILVLSQVTFSEQLSPKEVVNKRAKAHNIEEFLSTYAEDVRIGASDCDAFAKGKEHIKKVFGPLFKKKTST